MLTKALGSRVLAAIALCAVLLVTTAGVEAAPPSQPERTDWLTYAGSNSRQGVNSAERTLTQRTVERLHEKWSLGLGSYTTTSPIVVSNVKVQGARHRTLVFSGTEHGHLFAVDAATGRPVWRRQLGKIRTDCPDIPDKVFGVTGTPVADPAAGRIYVVGGTGLLYALDLATGATVRAWPVKLFADPAREHVYSGLTLANGRIYASTASYCDTRPFRGQVIAVDVLRSRVAARFYPTGRHDGGGVWAAGGVSVNPEGAVFVSTGNSFGASQHAQMAERVVRLTPGLRVVASHHPRLVGPDVDFASAPTLFTPRGCPPLLAVENKSGALLIYEQDAIMRGPLQRIQVASNRAAGFIGTPAYDAATRMLFVGSPSDSNMGPYRHGMLAFAVNRQCRLALSWQTTLGPDRNPFNIMSGPAVAGGVVYFGDGIGRRLRALDQRSGKVLWDSGTSIKGFVFIAPTVVGGTLYINAWDRKLHAYSLR